MKDGYNGTQLRVETYPDLDSVKANIDLVLERIAKDRDHVWQDEVSPGCTYEDLVRTLICAKKVIGMSSKDIAWIKASFEEDAAILARWKGSII